MLKREIVEFIAEERVHCGNENCRIFLFTFELVHDYMNKKIKSVGNVFFSRRFLCEFMFKKVSNLQTLNCTLVRTSANKCAARVWKFETRFTPPHWYTTVRSNELKQHFDKFNWGAFLVSLHLAYSVFAYFRVRLFHICLFRVGLFRVRLFHIHLIPSSPIQCSPFPYSPIAYSSLE